jgi:hypothetical protein
MHDDSVTTTWKRLTDKVKRAWGEGVADAAAVALERLPAAPAIPHADSMSLEEGAGSSSSPAHAATAAAGCRTDRDAEAIQQAAPLATWEDEGGMTSGCVQAPSQRSDARSAGTAVEGTGGD